jgi:hypothetical protein
MKEPQVTSAKKDLDEKFLPGTEQGRDETDSAAAPSQQIATEESSEKKEEDNDDISRLQMKRDDSDANRTEETTSPTNKMEIDEGKTFNKNVKKVQEKDRAKVSGTATGYT